MQKCGQGPLSGLVGDELGDATSRCLEVSVTLTVNSCTCPHAADNTVECRALLQKSHHALELGDCQLALLQAQQAVQAGQQNSCAKCLYTAFWHLGCVYVHAADYGRGAAAFAEAQRVATAAGDTALCETIDLCRQLCLALDRVAQADYWLANLRVNACQHLAEADARLRTALDMVTLHEFADSNSKQLALATASSALPEKHQASAGSAGVGSEGFPQADFDIRCLGGFTLEHHACPVVLPRNRKVETVLKYLVMHHGHPVPRDVLMGLGWPDAEPKVAANSLNTTISLLRGHLSAALGRSVPGSPVLLEEERYSINPALVLRVDVAEFDACYERGLAHDRAGRTAEAIDAYRAAAALYQGDLVMDDWSDAPTIIERERLAHMHMTLLGRLTEHCLAQSDYEAAIHYAHRLLQQDSCNEEAYCQLMRCLSRLGRRAQALHQYDLCESLLRRELDLEPSADTKALRRRIALGECV